jgi:hypothetical protein
MGDPRGELGGGYGLRVRRPCDRLRGGVQGLAPLDHGLLPLPAERPDTMGAFPITSAVAAGVERDARTMVTSAMFTEAKPTEETSAKANVASQSIHPASAVARWRDCHRPAGHDGMTRATRSEATPTAQEKRSGRLGGAQAPGIPSVHADAHGREAERGDHEDDRPGRSP